MRASLCAVAVIRFSCQPAAQERKQGVAFSTFEARHGVLCGFPLLALRAGTMSQTRTLSTQICAHDAKCFTVGHFV